MGVFDVHCAYSGIALNGPTQLLLLAKEKDDWRVISAPLRDTYDRYGRIDFPSDEEDGSFNDFKAWAGEHFGVTDSDDIFEKMVDGEARWRGQQIAYALVDAGVYDALPVDSIAADKHLPQNLQRSWKSVLKDLTPIDFDDSDQYCGFEGKYGCRSRVELALQRFADSPKIVAAINANAESWRELDE